MLRREGAKALQSPSLGIPFHWKVGGIQVHILRHVPHIGGRGRPLCCAVAIGVRWEGSLGKAKQRQPIPCAYFLWEVVDLEHGDDGHRMEGPDPIFRWTRRGVWMPS